MPLFEPNSFVYFPSTDHGWSVGSVVSQTGDNVVVAPLDDPEVHETFASGVLVAAPNDRTPPDDLTSSSVVISQPLILDSLRARFELASYYTYIGPILLAVNPYQKLNIYTTKYINLYKNRSSSLATLAPHVFAIAQSAYENLVSYNKPQSVLVSGESGAGKTETTKLLLQHLAVVSTTSRSSRNTNLSQQILEANPVLESFGNAKTLRNDNSSRFGKFIKIFFDKNCMVSGGVIEQYLLETTRIVSPNKVCFIIYYLLFIIYLYILTIKLVSLE
jgi:myosin heavy subunit